MSWDAAQRLTGLDGVTFAYNGLHEIISRTKNSTTQYYYHNHALGLSPIVAEEENGNISRYYIGYIRNSQKAIMGNPWQSKRYTGNYLFKISMM